MSKVKAIRLAILAIAVIALSVVSASAMPKAINYQGRLTNTAGEPVNATVSINFAIYNAPTKGIPLWSETQSSVVIVDGAFSVKLGSVVPIDLPFDETYYLGVNVNGNGWMLPRAELVSVPYAMRAATVDTVPAHSHDEVAIVCDNDVTVNDETSTTIYNACVSGGDSEVEVLYFIDGSGHEEPRPGISHLEDLIISFPLDPPADTNNFSISITGFSSNPNLAVVAVGGGDTTFQVIDVTGGEDYERTYRPGNYHIENLILRLASGTPDTEPVFNEFYNWWLEIKAGAFVRRDITVDILDGGGSPVNSFIFRDCFPSIYRVRDADGYVEFELAVYGVETSGGNPIFADWYDAEIREDLAESLRVLSVCEHPSCSGRPVRYEDTFMTRFEFPDLNKDEANVEVYEKFHFKPNIVIY